MDLATSACRVLASDSAFSKLLPSRSRPAAPKAPLEDERKSLSISSCCNHSLTAASAPCRIVPFSWRSELDLILSWPQVSALPVHVAVMSFAESAIAEKGVTAITIHEQIATPHEMVCPAENPVRTDARHIRAKHISCGKNPGSSFCSSKSHHVAILIP